MRPIVGWALEGPSFTGAALGQARLGEPAWGPLGLLRDLELRLGLPHEEALPSARVPLYRARIGRLADSRAFYSRSFAVDALGTAQALLAWRDALVDAGWDGAPIVGGGERIDALAAIEPPISEAFPPATADRLARAETGLRARETQSVIYEEIKLVEAREIWSERWQRVFSLLQQSGTRLSRAHSKFRGAAETTDLGRLQRLIRSERPTREQTTAPLRGDGSLLLLRGETPDELAELAAALLGRWRDGALVVRSLRDATLEAALRRHGMPGQGRSGRSEWRPAMQVLPLVLELAYEPRDPYRVLELLTLPAGPFSGLIGSTLARAVSRQPGIGGQAWLERKRRLLERLLENELKSLGGSGEAAAEVRVAERMRFVTQWLESPGATPQGATRESLLALAASVRSWLEQRVAVGDGDVYSAAHAQACAFLEAIDHDARALLSRQDVRQLLDSVVRVPHALTLSDEQAGRVPHVGHPAAVLGSAASVVFWGFVADVERPAATPPWNRAELDALAAAGVRFADPAGLLAAEADAWRRAILAAGERVVFVVPNWADGVAMSPHSLWDEIRARLAIDDVAAAKLTIDAQHLLRDGSDSWVAMQTLSTLALPEARAEWTLPLTLSMRAAEGTSSPATALTRLATCPLAWVLEHRADVRAGVISKVPEGPQLNGSLSHRVVEELFRDGSFDALESVFLERQASVVERLIRTEAATLLLPGSAIERTQLVAQVRRAMRALYRYLAQAGFRIAGVEELLEPNTAIGKLSARLDVRLVDDSGNAAVLDLKWGANSHQLLIQRGRAVQLAVYARALTNTDDPGAPTPPAGYFAMSSGRVLSADPRMKASGLLEGPGLDETWSRVERTTSEVMRALDSGRVLVGATKRALPLLEALGVPKADHSNHFAVEKTAVCEYCTYGVICGKAWEELR